MADRATTLEVLDSLKEPSPALLKAARDWSYTKYGKPIGNDAAIGCWTAMLAAARKEAEDK